MINYDFDKLMKNNNEYRKIIEISTHNLVKMNLPQRFRPTEERFLFDERNYKSFPYFFKKYYLNIYSRIQFPDDMIVKINNDTIIEKHNYNKSDGYIDNDKFRDDLRSNNDIIQILRGDTSYKIKIYDKEFVVSGEKLEMKISQRVYGGGEDLEVKISISGNNEIDTYYLINPIMR